MKVTIISVGKIKEKFFSDAIKEYTKRISKFSKIEEIQISDERCDDNYSQKEIEQVVEKESTKIMKKIKDNSYVIVLCIEGNQISSVDLAKKMKSIYMSYGSDIVFVIGGSNGLSNVVKERADFKLSFSKMTFPHQLFKVLLLEQIYRAFKINNGESYHK